MEYKWYSVLMVKIAMADLTEDCIFYYRQSYNIDKSSSTSCLIII